MFWKIGGYRAARKAAGPVPKKAEDLERYYTKLHGELVKLPRFQFKVARVVEAVRVALM